jgi:hypothetical protein
MWGEWSLAVFKDIYQYFAKSSGVWELRKK